SSGHTLYELEAALLYDVGSAGYAYPFHDARKINQDDLRTHGAVAFGVRARSGPRGWQSSRPQLKSNPMEDRVMLNNSQGKKQEVEDHRRNVKFSKNKTSSCNDSLNVKSLNVNFVCATCGKSVLNDKHDMCVLNSLDGVNSQTKMPVVVPLVEIILFIVDSRCSKHMTGNLKLLTNFVENFLGTVIFRNDQIAPILGYGDLVQGDITIKRVYYVDGLNRILFSVGQFCDANFGSCFSDIVTSMVMTSSSLSSELRHHQLAFKE
nr:hypothetical protein [Tanacetum cinerariifolium]